MGANTASRARGGGAVARPPPPLDVTAVAAWSTGRDSGQGFAVLDRESGLSGGSWDGDWVIGEGIMN
jgi:hypothetical protein